MFLTIVDIYARPQTLEQLHPLLDAFDIGIAEPQVELEHVPH
jgi:hypothetical protein